MASPPCPALARLPYEQRKPEELWQGCRDFQDRWKTESSSTPTCSEMIQKRMLEFNEQKAIHLVWMSNKLEGTLPAGAREFETYAALKRCLESENQPDVAIASDTGGSDDSDRRSRRQLSQHMHAYRRLCVKAISDREQFSDKLILETHRILMEGLENEGHPVKAGEYRTIPVCAGLDHVFPSHEVIPTKMPEIVAKYNQKAADPDHDPYQLASWLLLEVISLHPFEDGNGRLCRLLWCYSLMCDGLPFPTTISSGHKKAYKHYIDALRKCQRNCNDDHPHLTSLTVLSVHNGWNNFFFNWDKYEKPSIT